VLPTVILNQGYYGWLAGHQTLTYPDGFQPIKGVYSQEYISIMIELKEN
jgi:hypothetical protein